MKLTAAAGLDVTSSGGRLVFGSATIDAPPPSGGDDTPTLVNLLRAARPGSTVVFPRADYRIDGTVEIVRGRDLTIVGNGAAFNAGTVGDRNRSHWRLTDCSGIHLSDISIRGAHPNPGMNGDGGDNEAQHGFDILGSRDITIADCVVRSTFGDFVYVGNAGDAGWSENVTVTRCDLQWNGRQGFSVVAGQNVELSYSTIRQVRRSFLDLEPATHVGGALDIRIHHNTVSDFRLNFLASQGASTPIGDVSITDNQVRVHMPIAVQPSALAQIRRGPFTIARNWAIGGTSNPGGGAMWFTNCDGVHVFDNYHPLYEPYGKATMYLVRTRDCTDIEVRDNRIPGGLGQWAPM